MNFGPGSTHILKNERREMSVINIIFDGPPSHDGGRFVEVETDEGKSINAGEWIERPDGFWALRITELPENEIQEREQRNHGEN